MPQTLSVFPFDWDLFYIWSLLLLDSNVFLVESGYFILYNLRCLFWTNSSKFWKNSSNIWMIFLKASRRIFKTFNSVCFSSSYFLMESFTAFIIEMQRRQNSLWKRQNSLWKNVSCVCSRSWFTFTFFWQASIASECLSCPQGCLIGFKNT